MYPHKDACPRCRQSYPSRPADFNSDVVCAFLSGKFSIDNWACATMQKLRSQEVLGSTNGYANHKFNEDENGAMLPDGQGGFLILSWYKRRGRTQFARMLNVGAELRDVTLEDAERVIAYLEH